MRKERDRGERDRKEKRERERKAKRKRKKNKQDTYRGGPLYARLYKSLCRAEKEAIEAGLLMPASIA